MIPAPGGFTGTGERQHQPNEEKMHFVITNCDICYEGKEWCALQDENNWGDLGVSQVSLVWKTFQEDKIV